MKDEWKVEMCETSFGPGPAGQNRGQKFKLYGTGTKTKTTRLNWDQK